MKGWGGLLFVLLIGNVGGFIIGLSTAESLCFCDDRTISGLVAKCKAKDAHLSITLGEPVCLRGKIEEFPP